MLLFLVVPPLKDEDANNYY